MQLTKQQRIFIVTQYIHNKSLQQIRQAFELQFPECAPPTNHTILKTFRKFQDKGTILNLNKGNSGRLKTGRTPENINRIHDMLVEDPRVSTRRNETGLSRCTVNRIIRKDLNWFPYRIEEHQQLLETDYPRRVTFAQWFLGKEEHFTENLVVGDEAAFFLNYSPNTQIHRYYAPKTHVPQENLFERSMNREKLSVWAGLCGNGSIIGPFFNENNFNSERYLEMLNNENDGAPAHRNNIVKTRLSEVFTHRIIGIGFDTEWPPRSPDMTPCDYFLWGHVKNQVYSTVPTDLLDLRARIILVFEELKDNPNLIRKVMTSMRKRAQCCIERDGRHIEKRRDVNF